MGKPKGTTEEQKTEIRTFIAEGHTYDEASARFDLAKSRISRIVKEKPKDPSAQSSPVKPEERRVPPDYPLVTVPLSPKQGWLSCTILYHPAPLGMLASAWNSGEIKEQLVVRYHCNGARRL